MGMAEYSINHAVIADLLKNDTAVWSEVYEVTKETMEHWKDIAPINKHGDISEGKPHKLKSGYVDEPGSYRDSIRMRMVKNPTRIKGRVEATDYKSYWLEGYKSVNAHNDPPPEPMLHTLSWLMGRGLAIADNKGALSDAADEAA
ncbi:MAG: hypothetical protein J2P17_29990 [Mycobacterium sp.]|nr:hypothetical protein [Mycobacterium sp.]